MINNAKILPLHLERNAFVYIRQSSLRQVEENLESRDLQYQLVLRARSLGWVEDRILVIDDDLGKSAISSSQRAGFQSLVAAVGLRQVGIILVTDVSRLARNCADWYKLLDLASLYETLISDASGIYDPRIYDDRLLLGLKGTFSEAQWYSMRLHLGAAKFNKAKRGDLHVLLPVGFVRIADDRIALHPDLQVQSVIRHIFAEFDRLGSAHKVLRALRDQSLSLPRRSASSRETDVCWVRPSFSAIYAFLKNPAYAGTYAYGKHHATHLPGDPSKSVNHLLPLSDWPVLIPDAFPAFISWDHFLRNQEHLALNAQGTHWVRGSPHDGLALLQGIALCGRCGRLMHVRYSHATAYVCDHDSYQYAAKRCQTFTSAFIDPFVEEVFLQAVQPARLQAALAALDQIDLHRHSLSTQWLQRLERAAYDSSLARRRFERVDPDNRLVASSLEQDWEDCLRKQAALENEWRLAQQHQLLPLSDPDRQSILRLASDLPNLWLKASSADRKRLLRCLIHDVTLDSFSRPGFNRLLIRWHTGASTSLDVPRPPHGTPPATNVANHIRSLASHLPDDRIADLLNAQAFPTATGLPWTLERIRAVRRKHKIPSACPLSTSTCGPRGDGLLRSAEVALRLNVHPCMISAWFRQGLLSGCQRKPGSPLWIRLNDDDLHRIDGSAQWLPEMIPFLDAPPLLHVTSDQLRAMILSGQFSPFRLHFHDSWRWFLLPASNPLDSDH